MATKPEDINPFAQFVEQPKAEPAKKATPEANPFAQFVPYEVGTGLGDASKMIAAGAIGPTLAIPKGIEAAAKARLEDLRKQAYSNVRSNIGALDDDDDDDFNLDD